LTNHKLQETLGLHRALGQLVHERPQCGGLWTSRAGNSGDHCYRSRRCPPQWVAVKQMLWKGLKTDLRCSLQRCLLCGQRGFLSIS